LADWNLRKFILRKAGPGIEDRLVEEGQAVVFLPTTDTEFADKFPSHGIYETRNWDVICKAQDLGMLVRQRKSEVQALIDDGFQEEFGFDPPIPEAKTHADKIWTSTPAVPKATKGPKGPKKGGKREKLKPKK